MCFPKSTISLLDFWHVLKLPIHLFYTQKLDTQRLSISSVVSMLNSWLECRPLSMIAEPPTLKLHLYPIVKAGVWIWEEMLMVLNWGGYLSILGQVPAILWSEGATKWMNIVVKSSRLRCFLCCNRLCPLSFQSKMWLRTTKMWNPLSYFESRVSKSNVLDSDLLLHFSIH